MNDLFITEGAMRTFVNQPGILEIAIAALADDVELHMVANRDNGTDAESIIIDYVLSLRLFIKDTENVSKQVNEYLKGRGCGGCVNDD